MEPYLFAPHVNKPLASSSFGFVPSTVELYKSNAVYPSKSFNDGSVSDRLRSKMLDYVISLAVEFQFFEQFSSPSGEIASIQSSVQRCPSTFCIWEIDIDPRVCEQQLCVFECSGIQRSYCEVQNGPSEPVPSIHVTDREGLSCRYRRECR